MLHAVALQVLRAEVSQKFLPCRIVRIDPVVQFVGEELAAEVALKHGAFATLEEHFLGREVGEQFLHIVGGTFGTEKFARRDVEQGQATSRLAKVDGSQEVVLLGVQHVIGQRHTRGHQFGDAALHQLLRQFGVFQLVADGHTLACPDEFGQIRIQRMIGKSSHRRSAGRCARHAAPLRQRNAQNLGCHTGILVVCLIEVTTTKQQQSIRMLCLKIVKLFHHRGEFFLLRHNLLSIHLPTKVTLFLSSHQMNGQVFI